jgi:hypothetical protein
MKTTAILCFIFILFSSSCFSQDTITPVRVPATIMNGDTVPTIEINTAMVFPTGRYPTEADLVKYYRLVYNVRKVYPYAKLAAMKLGEYKKVLDTIPSERKRKQYIKHAQKELESQFGEDLKKLTFSQGKILIKLIYRETGNSTFDIVKELRGSFSAFIWQTMARLFGYDLKTSYDPAGEDQAIEKIVQLINNGS